MTGPALVPLDVARSELGIGRTTAYLLAREHGELVPGVPVFRIRGTWRVSRAQLDRVKSTSETSADLPLDQLRSEVAALRRQVEGLLHLVGWQAATTATVINQIEKEGPAGPAEAERTS